MAERSPGVKYDTAEAMPIGYRHHLQRPTNPKPADQRRCQTELEQERDQVRVHEVGPVKGGQILLDGKCYLSHGAELVLDQHVDNVHQHKDADNHLQVMVTADGAGQIL